MTDTLTATRGKAKLTLTWTAVSGATTYRVKRTNSIPSGWSTIHTASGAGSFDDTAVANNSNLYYKVEAIGDSIGTVTSNVIYDGPVLGTPTATATPGKARAVVDWSAVSDADSYDLRWSTNGFSWNTITGPHTGTTYTHTGLANTVTYQYQVRAKNDAGPGAWSPTGYAYIFLDAPRISISKNSSNEFILTWNSVTDADSYRVYRSTSSGGGFFHLQTVTGTTYNAGAIGAGYFFVVKSSNDGGYSTDSNEVNTGAAIGAKPTWEGACPLDPGGSCKMSPPTGGLPPTCPGPNSPRHGEPTNLATGSEAYSPDPDITAYNPNGIPAVWQRNFRSNQAKIGYSSPGLSTGWVHTYDVTLTPTTSTSAWEALTFAYPNGAAETITPQLSSGSPTGAFTTGAGVPYLVTGVASGTTNQWTSISFTWSDQTTWKFEPHGSGRYVLTQMTNRVGKSLAFSWDSQRRLTKITDAVSSVDLVTLTYGSYGLLTSAADCYDRKVLYTIAPVTTVSGGPYAHTSVSQLVPHATGTASARTSYGYVSRLNRTFLSTLTVPSSTGTGNSTATINYDTGGKVTSVVDSHGNVREYVYGSGSTQVKIKDSVGTVLLTWYQNYNSSNRDSGTTDSASNATLLEYLDANNPSKVTRTTDAKGRETEYTYDSHGNLTSVTTPRNVTTTYTWDYTDFSLGRLVEIQEGTKPSTTITYFEPSGLVESVTSPSPLGTGTVTRSYTYDSLGNVLTMTGPGNNADPSFVTTYSYTSDGSYSQTAAVGQPVRITDNGGNYTRFRYDAQGRATSSFDGLGNETTTTYNIAGQVLTVTYPATGQSGSGNSHTANAYLFPGGPLTSTSSYDENNTLVRQITCTYGSEGELLSVAGSTEPVTYTYDAADRVKTLKDGLNQTTTYTYNSRGFLSEVEYPGGDSIQYTDYDQTGNLLTRIDGNNLETNYEYDDPEDELTAISYVGMSGHDVSFTYDGYGRRATMVDATGTTAYAYDDLDEITSVTTTFTGLASKVISYSYYADGSRASMTSPVGTTSYTYDTSGRIITLQNPFSETTAWTYDNDDALASQTLHNGAVTTYTYNALSELTSLVNVDGSSNVLSQFTGMTHDGAGNRLAVTASIPAVSAYSGTTNYTCDTKDQLTQESSTRLSGFTNNFGYDAAGNPTTFKGGSRTYNSNNQLTSGMSYVYDSNGNPTTYNGATLTFDPENRMTAYGSALTAGYFGDGLRAWRNTSSGLVYFLYDGTSLVCELDSSGSVVATNTWGVNGLVSRRIGSTTVYYTFDERGGVTQRLDNTCNILTSHTTDAFGTLTSTSSTADPYSGFGAQWGYYSDVASGLQILGYRYYAPHAGRFVTRDPIGYLGGVNVYSYCQSSPVSAIDPEGLQGGSYSGYGDARGRMAEMQAAERIAEGKLIAESMGIVREILTRSARVRLAKRIAGIPVSQLPNRAGTSGLGTRWFEFSCGRPPGLIGPVKGEKRIIIVAHPDGSVHVGAPKWDSPHFGDRRAEPRYRQLPFTGHVGQEWLNRTPKDLRPKGIPRKLRGKG